MSVAFGAVTTVVGRATSLSVTPANPVGTMVRLVVTAVSASEGATPYPDSTGHAGWTLVANNRATTTGTSNGARQSTWWRVLDGSAADTFAATFAVTSAFIVQHNAVTGADPTSPISVTSSSAQSNANATALTAPSVTPTRLGLLDYTASQSFSATGVVASITEPAGMVEFSDVQDTPRLQLVMESATEQVTAVATGSRTGTATVSNPYVATLVVWGEPVNPPPTANAGPDQTITQVLVTLTGSGSDPGGSIASYAWAQTAGPAVVLSSASAQNPTFLANIVAATYTFSLTVTDNGGATGTDTVNVTVSVPEAPSPLRHRVAGAWV